MKIDMYTPRRHYEDLTSTLRTLSVSPIWLIFLLSTLILVFGIFTGYGVTRLYFGITIGIVIAIPVAILWVRQPFNAIIVWLLIAPFFVVTLTGPIRIVYWFTHRTIIPLAAIIAVLNGSARGRILRVGWIDFFLVAHLLINIFSVLYHYRNPKPGFIEIYDLVLVWMTLFWLIRITAPRETDLRRLMSAIIILCIIQGVVGTMMNISVTRPLLPEHWITSRRTTGTLYRAAEFSSTVMASMLLIAYYAFHVRKRWIRLLCFIALGVGGLAITFSFSRSTWLASITILTLFMIFYRRIIPYILVLAPFIVLLATADTFDDSRAFARERIGVQNTIDVRIISNYAALRMIAAKPFLGWGYDNFTRYHLDFIKPVGDTPVTDPYLSSHHTYLGMATELGLIGLMTFLMPWLLLLKRSFTRYKQLPQEGFYSRYLLLILWLGVLFWFIVTNSMNMRLAPWGMTWLGFLLGLIASIVDATEEPPYNNSVNSPITKPVIAR